MTVEGRIHQRSPAVSVWSVDARAIIDGRDHEVDPTLQRSVAQRLVGDRVDGCRQRRFVLLFSRLGSTPTGAGHTQPDQKYRRPNPSSTHLR
jgi:hypothetical protein